ncbi:MAG: hypothetical protein Q8Q24_01490, partial [bacterium]|nr:hypothetical protein [bacterium]
MGELGEYAQIEHQKIGQTTAKLKIDYLIGIGPLQKLTVEEAIKNGMKKEKAFWVTDVAEAAKVLEKIIQKGDLLYLKGSLKRHLERVIFILEGKNVCCAKVTCEHYHPCLSCPQLKG